jgi:hypothetical protein
MKDLSFSLKQVILFPAILIITMGGLHAQDKKIRDSVVRNMVETQAFTFVAQTAQPTGGRMRELTSTYQLDVRAGTVTADLPYFGRAYTAPIDPSKGGIQFTSTQFEYVSKPKKKGGWNIVIKPKENTDARQLLLDISPSGFANLQVLSNNRQSISFAGYVTDKKKQ